MFEILNDDCWLHILKYVTLSDQLALAKISKSLHCNVQHHWQSLKEAYFDRDVLEHFKQHQEEMHDFLQLASGTLQKLKLDRATKNLFESWRSYSFPKLVNLDCSMCYYESKEADAKTLMLTELFPNLTHLTLESSTSGQHVCNWYHLQELHLMSCEFLDTSTFVQIFSSLPLRKVSLLYYGYGANFGDGVLPISKCATLEELVIDDHHLLGDFLPNLLQLPRFRCLTVYTRDYYEYLLQVVSELRPKSVKSLHFNYSYWNSSRLCDYIMLMTSLRRLTLQEDDIEANQLYNICTALPHLEELHLMNLYVLPTPTQLWDIVAKCESLKVLNLSSNRLNDEFVDLSASCLERVLTGRSAISPLTLHVHNTQLERSRQGVVAKLKHPNLFISFESVDLNICNSRFIIIEFLPFMS